jgi:RHS repeat-associated protein
MTNKAIYRRDAGSRLTLFGRGSPIQDLLSPQYVVSAITSSAPTRDSAGATSEIRYRYSGAKVQAGGRGLLGFASIVTFDANPVDGGFAASEHIYRQDFPFVGSTLQTAKFTFAGAVTRGSAEIDACSVDPEATGRNCFFNPGVAADAAHPALGTVAPPGGLAMNGKRIQLSASLWGCKANGVTETCAFPEGVPATSCPDSGLSSNEIADNLIVFGDRAPLAAPIAASPTLFGAAQPLFPYVPRTFDVEFEPTTGAVTRHVCGLFAYDDGYGNATTSSVATFSDGSAQSGSQVAKKSTTNVHANDTTNWRLGRLQTSQVDDQRGASILTRFADFTYDLGPSTANTGLLKSETLQKNVANNQELRTLYDLDVWGNRVATYQCSKLKPDGNALSDAQCRDKTLVEQRPVEATGSTTAVHRYSLTTYDARGRYSTQMRVPFYSPIAARNVNEQASQTISERDEFGNATTVTDANGLVAKSRAGDLGRPYASADTTGRSVVVTYRWCGTQANEVSCPVGAAFREKTAAAGAPTSFSYFDVLGRPSLQVVESFNAGVSGKNWIARCTAYDAHGRAVFASEPAFLPAGNGVAAEPSFAAPWNTPCAGSIPATSTVHDVLGRVKQVLAPDNSSTTSTFLGLTTTITDSRGQSTLQTKNALGEVVSITQADDVTGTPTGMVVNHQYDAQGNLRFVTRDAGRGSIVSEVQYDALGRKVRTIDPDRGTVDYTYNAAGEVVRQVDARGDRIDYDYDALGRVWRRKSGRAAGFNPTEGALFADGFETSGAAAGAIVHDLFQHDAFCDGDSNNNLGLLVFEERNLAADTSCVGTAFDPVGALGEAPLGGSATTYRRAVLRDDLGRPFERYTLIVDGTPFFTERTTYDAFGRVSAFMDASGQTQTTIFTARGYVQQLRYSLAGTGTANGTFYEVLEQNARGQVVQERRSGVLTTTFGYDVARGWLENVCTGSSCSVQDWQFDFDTNANLLYRQRSAGTLREDFQYDLLNRLKLVTRSGSGTTPSSSSYSYDALGNLCTKDGQSYTYAGRDNCNEIGLAGSPHAVTKIGNTNFEYDGSGNQRIADDTTGTANDRYLEYDALDQAIFYLKGNLLNQTADGEFAYAPDRSRFKRIDRGAGQTTTTRYVGLIEQITRPTGVVETKRYLGGGAIVTTFSNQPGVVQDRYALTDQLGSVDVVVSDTGAIVSGEVSSFDAWGARRGTTWTGTGGALGTTTHGFTGHEHVDPVGIVHMNGRLYDPVIGRFVQADAMIDAGVQGLNRYSYVLNNPLSATDPTGQLTTREWGMIFSAVITMGAGSAINASVQAGTLTTMQGYVWAGALGAMSGAAQSHSLEGAAWGAVSALTFHGIGSYFESANWAHNGPHVMGTNLDLGGYAAKVLAHGVAGGAVQHLQGGEFGSGFASAGVVQAFSGSIDRLDPSNPDGFSVQRVLAAALIGGSVSDMTGGKFANGAVTAAFARAFNDEASRQSLAQRMRGTFKKDGSEGVDINLFDPRDKLHALAEGFPRVPGTRVIAGHADPSQEAMTDHRFGSTSRYEPENAALDLIRAGLDGVENILVLGCGAGSSGFATRLFQQLEVRGYSIPVTAPTGLTSFHTRTFQGQTHYYFPAFDGPNRPLGRDSRVFWSTTGAKR